MARAFTAHSSQTRSRLNIDRFAGNDLTNAPSSVALSRSPHAINMIRDVPGKVCKMQGFKTLFTASGKINGCFILQDNTAILHSGTDLYHILSWDNPLSSPLTIHLANTKSKGVYLADKLYIYDGINAVVWDKDNIVTLESIVKTPRVTIANLPSGGGAQYEQLNLLTPRFTETFVGTAQDTIYKLSYAPLDNAPVEVKILQGDKVYQILRENYEFTVNRATGQISFNSPPGVPLKAGEANVEITAAHTIAGYKERILSAKAICAYGIGGTQDRVFAGGSEKFPNRDYFSAQNDGTYFGDMSYSQLGAYDPIMGYSLLDGSLLTYKNSPFNKENIIVRHGEIIDKQPAFSVTATLPSTGLVSADSMGYLEGEPLFLSQEGIMAVTRTEANGTRYVQGRSFYLNGGLLKCKLNEAQATVWQDFYVLAAGDKLWLLDGLQPSSRAEGMPWSARQYEGYVRENCAACALWQQNGKLFFGTQDGKVCRFRDKSVEPSDYYDDEAPVKACWELPDFGGRDFYKNKTFTYMAVLLASAPITSVDVTAKCKGVRHRLYSDRARGGYLSFANLAFSKFTFRCDDTPRTLGARVRLKKVDKASFNMANDEAEPFGITEVALEYSENGNFK